MSIVSIPKTIIGTLLPTQISGCQLWFDAADQTTITLNGSTVASWNDKSGNGYSVAQSTASYQPTYTTNLLNGLPGIQLSGTRYLYQFGSNVSLFASSAATTVFMVAKNGSTIPNWNIVNTMWFSGVSAGTSRYHLSFGYGTSNGVTLFENPAFTQFGPTTVVPLGSNAIIGFSLSTGLNYINVNGTLTNYSGATLTSAADSTYFMFGDSRGGTLVTDMNVYEFVGFNKTLLETERQQIEGYLAQKWGLTSQLPPGHPGLTQTFYGTGKSTVVVPIKLLPYNIYTNYNPLTATGSTCILWLDASDPTTLFSDAAGTTLASVNSTVGYWQDKSSSGFNCTQATLSYRPTYVAAAKNGRSILSFNGLTNFLNLPQFTAVPLTIFFVAQGTVFLTNTFFLSLGSSGNTIMMRMLAAQAVYGVDANDANPITVIPTTNSDTNWHLWTLTISSSTVTFYFDGTLIGTSSWPKGSAYTFATNTIASWNQQVNSKATTLNIPEILFYSAVLGTTQQQQVEAYLTEKWGLTSQPSRGVASIVAIPKISFASSGLVITHQDGRPWKLTGTAVALNAGTQMSLTIYAGADVYNSANGRVGLFNNGSSTAAIRHSSYVMYANTFTANNYDFGWYFVSSGSKYLIYNDYPSIGSAWQVSYDPAQDRVLIVQPGDAKYGMLWNITPRLTLTYVHTSYPT